MGVVAAPRLRRPRPAAARRALAGRARPLAAAACVGVVVAAGVVIAVAAAAPNSPIVPALRRASPGWLQGPFAGAGVRVTFSGYLMLFAAMSAGYLGVLALGVRVPARWLLGAVAALHVAFLLAPPILSNDVFSYVAYARLGVVHGLDPYAQAPIAAPHDAVYVFTHWRHATSAYGPLFTLGSYPLAPLGVGGALWALKVASALASLGCVALVWKIAEQLGRSPVWAAAAFGLNPVLLVWTVGGAHNDTLMLMLLLAGVWLVLARRDALGGAAIVAGAAIKASAGLALPFVLLGVGLRRGGRALAGAVVAAAPSPAHGGVRQRPDRGGAPRGTARGHAGGAARIHGRDRDRAGAAGGARPPRR
jgi:hypothetical protein